MAGTTEGGKKAAQKNLERDPNFYKKNGAKGGLASNSAKGFGSNRALASIAGRKGGTKSRRRPTDHSPLSSDDKRTLERRG